MLNYLVRALKRFAVLIPGLAIAYISLHDIFPIVDKRLPLALAIFVTYVLGAYVLIPALIRVIRFIAPARHLQAYCVTPDGFASDPINIGIVGSKQELVATMKAAGWSIADRYTLSHITRAIVSTLLKHTYETAPMSRLYLFGRKQDIGFEIAIAGERGHRHHVRFWATAYKGSNDPQFGSIEWHKQRRRAITKDTLWVGAASRDTGLAFIRHNVQVTHMIHPDTNAERQLIVDGIQKAGRLGGQLSIRLRRPYKLTNRAWFGHLQSDGVLSVIQLKV